MKTSKKLALALLAVQASVFPFATISAEEAPVSRVIPVPVFMQENPGRGLALRSLRSYSVEGVDSVETGRLERALFRYFPDIRRVTPRQGGKGVIRLVLGKRSPAENISLVSGSADPDNMAGGAYALNVDSKGAVLSARSPEGLFYAIQTLGQMADNAREAPGKMRGIVPAVSIEDSPRFPYRGLLIDVSRHFRDKDFVMKQIDAMARLKMNVLHFHLTDAAGWRLQIDRYPRLTDLGAFRSGKTWKEWEAGGKRYLDYTDPDAEGGYYTKADIREILDYAADRFVTVIPEIEMPSHSEEVLAAYPELSCTGKAYTSSDFCPGNEKTFEFISNVLDEVIDLFPSEYINIGGDEAPKTHWKDCPRCAERMEKVGISDVEGLQSYLVHRVEQYINFKGRKLIGWDEIMEGGLAPNAAVVSWRGVEGGEKAAAAGHKAVMAPGRFCYLDSYQDAPSTQPEAIGGYLPLEKVYSFDPAPGSMSATARENVMGAEATLFAEYIPTAEHYEYMLYPRLSAMAEVAWSPREGMEFGKFRPAAARFNARLGREGYNVFDMDKERGNRPEALREEKHLARGKKVTYNVPWWNAYPAGGDSTLTDGRRGGWNYSDDLWQGFLYRGDERMDVTVDLGEKTPLREVYCDFMQICGPGVWLPAYVEVLFSDDGKHFRLVCEISHRQEKSDEVEFRRFGWEGNDYARYIRYRALTQGRNGCLFTDELIVR